MRRLAFYCVGLAFFALSSSAQANTFRFDTDPFAGTTALTTPGRQVIMNELFIDTFTIGTDVFSLDPAVFNVSNTVNFANDVAGNLPTGGVNVIVLESFDDDNNPATAFGAGQAANLIANRITTPGAGFFVYFNSGLNLARLVYSTDLNDNTADLKVLARMNNLTGQAGRDALPNFSAANFEITSTPVPEPSTLTMIALGAIGGARRLLRRKREMAA
jgi:hypothetical protein